MTQYPEAWLARELELCYANVSLVTDYDVGLEGMPDVPPVSADDGVRGFQPRTSIDCARSCSGRCRDRAAAGRLCATALSSAIVH